MPVQFKLRVDFSILKIKSEMTSDGKFTKRGGDLDFRQIYDVLIIICVKTYDRNSKMFDNFASCENVFEFQHQSKDKPRTCNYNQLSLKGEIFLDSQRKYLFE